MAVALDEYPIHQVPLSFAHVGTSDRNFYDRCIFHVIDRAGENLMLTGLGVYPNLGVIDAYACLRRGDRQTVVRTSDALGDDRLAQRVGPYRIEVLEPLRRIRVICDADEKGLGFDLVWESGFAAVDEPRHVTYDATGRGQLDASRFCQVGAWSGVIRVDGDEIAVTPDRWAGTRDRSWGIRPVGEAEPPGRAAAESTRDGFWWCWIPLQFDDFCLVVIMQEEPDGSRTLNEAVQVWRDGRRRQLGWPEVDIRYRSGTRWPEAATLHVGGPARKPVEVSIEPLLGVPLSVGCGYGADPDWSHGQWKGRGWVDGTVYDLTDPSIAGRLPFTLVDHTARATLDGQTGWGIFEHGSMGRHDPSGMVDWTSVAP